MKNSNDTIGDRIRDLPVCSAVPQPTAPPRAPCRLLKEGTNTTHTYRSSSQYIIIYKSLHDAHITELILSDNCSACFELTIIHLQEQKTTVTTASGNRYTVLLSAAIVEELELLNLANKCNRASQPPV